MRHGDNIQMATLSIPLFLCLSVYCQSLSTVNTGQCATSNTTQTHTLTDTHTWSSIKIKASVSSNQCCLINCTSWACDRQTAIVYACDVTNVPTNQPLFAYIMCMYACECVCIFSQAATTFACIIIYFWSKNKMKCRSGSSCCPHAQYPTQQQ